MSLNTLHLEGEGRPTQATSQFTVSHCAELRKIHFTLSSGSGFIRHSKELVSLRVAEYTHTRTHCTEKTGERCDKNKFITSSCPSFYLPRDKLMCTQRHLLDYLLIDTGDLTRTSSFITLITPVHEKTHNLGETKIADKNSLIIFLPRAQFVSLF